MNNAMPSFMKPAPGPYANMSSWGTMGSGTYGAQVETPEMYSMPPAATDILGNPLQMPQLPQIGAAYAPGMTVPGMNTGESLVGGGGGGMFGGIGAALKDSGFMGSTDANGVKTDGWGGMALGAASGLASTFLGMKQYGLAKKSLAENKRQFQVNYDAQKTTTNASLEDRQRARVASNAGAYQSVGEYMSTNGIK